MVKVDGVALILVVVFVKDDFGTVGVIAHQHVAKILVGLNVLGGSVARLGIRLAAKRRGLQGLACLVVDVRNRCLLGVWGVDNISIFTWIISWHEAIWTYRYTWNEAIWTYRFTINLWCISFVLRNNNLSGFSWVILVIRILGWYLPHEWFIILTNKESCP